MIGAIWNGVGVGGYGASVRAHAHDPVESLSIVEICTSSFSHANSLFSLSSDLIKVHDLVSIYVEVFFV